MEKKLKTKNIIRTINPYDNTKLKDYSIMDSKKVSNIIKDSNKAFNLWSSISLSKRLEYLKNLSNILKKNKLKYATLMTNEMGKVITESLAEIEKCAWLIDILVEKSKEWLKEEKISANGKEHIITYEPLGLIYIIMPWNYPFWQVFKVAIPPLVSGNTIILKHSSNVTGSALIIEEAFKEANMPNDIFRTLVINHQESEKIIENNLVKAISLTGSVKAGSLVASQSGKVIKKIILELGGSDPFIVLKDADINQAVKGAILGRIGNCGQICIGAKRFIVHKDIIEEFSKKFSEEVKKMIIGNPLDSKTQIGPMVNEKAVDKMVDFVNDAIKNGAKLLSGGKKIKTSFFEPAILINVNEKMKVFTEETFGPIAPIISFETEEEAIKIANNSEFGLNSSIWSSDLKKATKIARKLKVGGVFINNFSSSHPLIPLGGIKNSGFGKELSKFGIKEFVNIKPINIYEVKK